MNISVGDVIVDDVPHLVVALLTNLSLPSTQTLPPPSPKVLRRAYPPLEAMWVPLEQREGLSRMGPT
jgi:hypothetical protein